MQSLTPNDVKPSFIEKAFEKRYFYILACLGLYFDIVYFAKTQQNISQFRLNDIDKSMSFGTVFALSVGYFFLMSLVPKIRFEVMMIFWKPLCWLFTRQYEYPMDPRYVPMRKVLAYAIQHNDQVLYSEYLAKSKNDDERDRLNDISFVLSMLLIADVAYPGLVLYDFFNLVFAEGRIIAVLLFLLIVVWNFLKSLRPYYYGGDYIFLPDHPLSVAQQKERKIL